MRIPRKIKVGGSWYNVDMSKELDGQCGRCDLTEQTIYISKELTRDQKEVTLWHEIIHAINICIHDQSVEFLAQSLYQVLKDNKFIR